MSWKNSVIALAILTVASSGVRAGGREETTVVNAMDVLAQSTKIPETGIPSALLQKAHGVLILPNVVKAGLVVGGRHGKGVFFVRGKDGTWANPIFVTLTGGSVGWQAGVQSADLVLVFKSPKGVERLLQGKGKLTLGGDASIAAGPVGRQAAAATDGMLQAEIYSYSRSRGLFVGVSLEGDSLRIDWHGNDSYYRRAITPAEIVAGNGVLIPESALRLRTLLMNSTAPKAVLEPPVGPGPMLPPVEIAPPRKP